MGKMFLNQLLEFNIKAEDIELLLSYFTTKQYKKDEHIIWEGQVCNYFFYIERGLVKLISYHNDREFIMHFFNEGFFVSVIDSFTLRQPSDYELIALEDCELLLLHRDHFEKICKANHSLETLFRRIMQVALSNMLGRISTRLKYDASCRYDLFIKEYPDLMQRISLGDLANYLGITQASLSKIQAKK